MKTVKTLYVPNYMAQLLSAAIKGYILSLESVWSDLLMCLNEYKSLFLFMWAIPLV